MTTDRLGTDDEWDALAKSITKRVYRYIWIAAIVGYAVGFTIGRLTV